MPDSAFSTQMAQMIAQARPKVIAGGGGHRGIAGGMGTLGGTEKSSNISAAVDIGPWMRLFGYKTPEEKQKIGQQFVTALDNFSDEDKENIINQESTQKILEGAQKSGVPGIIVEGPGPYGAQRYNVAKPTEQAKIRGLNEPQIEAGGAGLGPAEQLTTRKERVAKAARGPTEAEMLVGPQGEKLVKAKREILAPHESEINLRNAAIAEHQADTALKKKQLEMAPAQFELTKKKAEAEIYYHTKLGDEADSRSKVLKQELLTGLTPRVLQGIKQTDQAFDDFWKGYVLKNSNITADDDKTGFQKVAEMEGAVAELISGYKFYTGKGQGGERGVRRLFSLVDREFEKPAQEGTKWLGISSTPTQATSDQQSIRRYYVRKGIEMLKESDFLSGDGLINKNNPSSIGLAKKVIDWARQMKMSDAEIDYLFRYGKFPTKQPAQGTPLPLEGGGQ